MNKLQRSNQDVSLESSRASSRTRILPALVAAISLTILVSLSGCKKEEPAPPTAEQIEEERQEHKSHAQREMEDMRN